MESAKIEQTKLTVSDKEHVFTASGKIIIFPGFLNHLPVTSSTQKRISLNLELKCNEQDKDIFGL